jgi:hypothetical protein
MGRIRLYPAGEALRMRQCAHGDSLSSGVRRLRRDLMVGLVPVLDAEQTQHR